MTQGEPTNPEKTQAAGAPEALTFASGRYVATRLLDEGGQKRVYLGRDTQLHRDVAIAVIKAEGLDEAALDRVRREAQTIASLGAQPNVITIFDVGEEDGRSYTVCEYAPGGALRQELRSADGPLPLARALAIALDVCQGLALAHAHGILHRDVKPENILFTSAGTAKLGDFGLAVAFGQSRMTAPGTVLGTAAYMPPEQAQGVEVDARGDLYSLGCVLYELVTGRPPFVGDDMISVVSQHINSAPEAPSWHNKEVPPSLDALILRLLAKAPHQRPESAMAVLESLSAIASAPAPTAEPETAVVTLLFCDMVGSTELLTALGDDANDEVRRVLLTALEREAREHRGIVVKSAGDGLMVSFRTSAADAVACAIAMQRAAGQVERSGARVGLELRVGISSGEASHEGGDWFGTPVVEAARLEAAARPGQILVSEMVRGLVGTRGGAQFRSAGKRELKGFARPVPVVEVVWRDDSTPPPVKRKPQRPRRRRTLVAGAALVVVAGAAGAAGILLMLRDPGGDKAALIPVTTLVAEGYVPKLEPRECPAELTSDPAVRCQDLVVPETRANPAGRQIRIFVMVAPSNVEPAGIPPTVFIGGALGTGTYFLGGGVFSQPAGSDLRDYGDVVVFGVRGRQFSQPALACPEVPARRELMALPDNGPEANKLWLDAAEQCGRRLVTEGYDLDAYGQDEIVKDVRDLAIAMGWRQINVAGRYDVARTAVLLAARYPDLVRSVVLDAPYPVDATWYDDRLSNFNAALQAYYAACRVDPACERAFPNLEQAVPALYAQYQQDPVVVTVPDPAGGPDIDVLYNGDREADIVSLGLTGQEILPIIAPLLVSEDEAGALQTVANYLVTVSGDPYGDPSGANFSAYCEDVDQRVVRGDLRAQETLYPLFRVFAHDPLFDLCRRWPTKARSGAIALLETASAVPAFIITGGLNPYAPPAYAQRAAKSFTHATLAVFPSLTAFPSVATGQLLANPNEPPCISALRLAFLRHPTANLDIAGCIAKVPPIAFEGTGQAGTTPAAPTSSAP